MTAGLDYLGARAGVVAALPGDPIDLPRATEAVAALLDALGVDHHRPELSETPGRFARMFADVSAPEATVLATGHPIVTATHPRPVRCVASWSASTCQLNEAPLVTSPTPDRPARQPRDRGCCREEPAMTDHAVPVPDYPPDELQRAYATQARRQVQASHRSRRRQTSPLPRDRSPVCDHLTDYRLITAALFAFVGLWALTILWTWLASTHDPVWWWFTATGATLTVALGTATPLVERRCDHPGTQR